MKIKKFIPVVIFLIIILGIYTLSGYRFSYEATITVLEDTSAKNIEVIKYIQHTENTKLVIYKNLENETYGQQEIKTKYGFLHSITSGIFGYHLKENSPFMIIMNHGTHYHDQKTSNYMLYIKTNDKEIKYISVGGNTVDYDYKADINLKLEDIRSMKEIYQVQEVINGEVYFTGKDIDIETLLTYYDVKGFNKDGEIIAISFRGGEGVYIDDIEK